MESESQLRWTGERLVTDETLGKGVIEHLHRYAITLPFIRNKKILDIACGEGYGTNLMAEYARSAIGVDISRETIEHAATKYLKSNLSYFEGSAIDIPLKNSSIDVVVSFETLEHHPHHEEMMLEVKRILTPGGVLIISTPERDNYKKIDKDNPFHVKELNFGEFKSLIKKHFAFYTFLGQNYVNGSVMIPVEAEHSNPLEYNGDFEKINTEDFNNNRLYNIAIASDITLQENAIKSSFFNGSENLHIYYHKIIEAAVTLNTLRIQNTASYKIGNLIIRPFKKLFNFFNDFFMSKRIKST